jgi:hypothetical protein
VNKACFSGYCNYCVTRIGIRKFRNLNNGICSECEKYQKRLGLFITVPESKPTKVKKVPIVRVTNPLLKADEKQLIQLFHQLQSEGIGRNWRAAAAKRLGWSQEKVKEIAKRTRQGTELIPVPIEQQLINYLTHEWQSAHQILLHFPNIKYDWIQVNLNKLAEAGEIDRKKCQPNRNQYRLK